MRRPFSTQIELAVQDRLRATVLGLQRALHPSFTLGAAAEQAVSEWCERQEKKHNQGRRWPVPESLTRGRRLDHDVDPPPPSPTEQAEQRRTS